MIETNVKILFQKLVEILINKDTDAFNELIISKTELKKMIEAFAKKEGEKPKLKYKALKREMINSFKELYHEVYEDDIDLENGKITDIDARLKLDLGKHKQYSCEIIWETKDKTVAFDFHAVQVENDSLKLIDSLSRKILKTNVLDEFKTKDDKEGIEKALKRFRNAEIFYLDFEKEKARRVFEREIAEGNFDEDEEFDEEEYEFDEDYTAVSLAFKKKATPEEISETETRLGFKLPQSLSEFYTQTGNGVGKGEQLEIFSTGKITGVIDFMQDWISEAMPYDLFKVRGSKEMGEGFGKPLSDSEQALVKSINSDFYVFSVHWHDYQRLEILMFNRDHKVCGIQVDIHEDQYIFDEYLKDFHQNTKLHNELTPFFNKYIDNLISEDIANDFYAENGLNELFYMMENS